MTSSLEVRLVTWQTYNLARTPVVARATMTTMTSTKGAQSFERHLKHETMMRFATSDALTEIVCVLLSRAALNWAYGSRVREYKADVGVGEEGEVGTSRSCRLGKHFSFDHCSLLLFCLHSLPETRAAAVYSVCSRDALERFRVTRDFRL